jgi:hypothetical protein
MQAYTPENDSKQASASMKNYAEANCIIAQRTFETACKKLLSRGFRGPEPPLVIIRTQKSAQKKHSKN